MFLLVVGTTASWADFTDFKLVLAKGYEGCLVTDEEFATQYTPVEFGYVVNSDGTVSRVAKDDPTSMGTIKGKSHSEHGITNFEMTVKVEGNVEVGMGTCAWGGDVKINGTSTFTSNNGKCWHNDKVNNVAYGKYIGEAGTITISGGSYTPYVSVAKIGEVAKYDVKYDLNGLSNGSKAPEGVTVVDGDSFSIPVNRTVYAEGQTLVGWTDGDKVYKIGDAVTPTKSITLSPVFDENSVTLADRTEPVTLVWDFQTKNGAPTLSYQGQDGLIYVTQATVEGQTIDVKLDYSTNPGKVANGNWNDWCQMNGGTKFTIPSCKGATVSIESYSATTTTTIDGMTDYTANGNVVTAEIGNKAESIDIVIGDGSYFRYIKAVLPVVAAPAGKTYTNEPASVTFAMNNASDVNANVAAPEDAFQTIAFDAGEAQVVGVATIGDMTPAKVTTGLKIQPKNGASDVITWLVKPAAGLSFAPSHITGYINRYGTDSEDGVKVSAKLGDGSAIALGTFTAVRESKDNTQKFAAKAVYKYDITLTADQQAALAGEDGFTLISTVGVGNTKQAGFGEVVIEGTVSGTLADVNKYTVDVVALPEEGGSVSIYPKSDEYVEGDEVTLTATENFGYDFVNWTNSLSEEVSKDPKFKTTVSANETYYANFKKVNTYELAIDVEGGAKTYMVSLSPAPTVVDGKNMYEEGTKVTMTASSNKVLTFNNWSNGETASEMAINMTEDKAFTAVYSACDFIVAWDMQQKGVCPRPADFYAEENDAVQLQMLDADGKTYGGLDKTEQAAGGYEGRPGIVNWVNTLPVGTTYWQTQINAANFTGLKVVSAMVYNYNAYQKYNVQYSLDGENWTTAGTIFMEGTKKWTDLEAALPAECDNQAKVYVRWIADLTSKKDGTESANDGACMGAIYILGTAQVVDDGIAPSLVSSVPENNAAGASANGKIVLTFDKKVQLTDNAKATIGAVALTPVVSGKTVTCEYKGLDYSSDYTFTLAGGSIVDLTGNNVLADEIVINFQTKVKPSVEKGMYDFIVPDDGTISEAIAAANKRGANATDRFRIFIKNGNYVTDTNGTTTGGDGKTYDDPRSYLSSPFVSFIGESMEGVVITNQTPASTWDNGYGAACPLEGIGNGDVLIIQKSGHDAYFQNLTMKSSMGDAHGRDIVLNDQSNRTIFKDACLWGYQDTYVSNNNNGKFYFEGGVLRGRTDYLCGKGDVYYNEVTLQQCGGGGYLAVPSVAKNYGYVFNNCYIKKETSDVTFYLGRPWGSGTPVACFINTKMDGAPLGNGWADMSGGYPKRFAEYNSFLSSGTQIDLSGRRTSWTDKEGVAHANDPILTLDDVASMSLANVMGQDDDWDPTALTEQASAPQNVTLTDGTVLAWDNSNYVFCWAVIKNGDIVDFTTVPTFIVDDATATWSVRAANEMGGLSEATVASTTTAITEVASKPSSSVMYNISGQRVNANAKGIVIQKGQKYIVK